MSVIPTELERLVDEYVDGRKWDTLVGRAWDMTQEESRDEFKAFLGRQFQAFIDQSPSVALRELREKLRFQAARTSGAVSVQGVTRQGDAGAHDPRDRGYL